MADTVIDRFITEVLFRDDPEAINRIERGVNRLRGGLDAASTAAFAIGGALTAAFGGGAHGIQHVRGRMGRGGRENRSGRRRA